MYNKTIEDSQGKREVNNFYHFSSFIGHFYRDFPKYRVVSINNHPLDLSKLGEYRISRFIRDPRDLVISGYHYHKRGAEKWCKIINPTIQDWQVVNGCKPVQMQARESFQSHLEGLNLEDGLLAEIEFRRRHLESMFHWPEGDPHIKIFRYENIVTNLPQVISDIFSFYELPDSEREQAVNLAESFSASGPNALKQHIRDPSPNQWKKYFTPKVSEYFTERYGILLEKYDYE
jgi:hypothetical protein